MNAADQSSWAAVEVVKPLQLDKAGDKVPDPVRFDVENAIAMVNAIETP